MKQLKMLLAPSTMILGLTLAAHTASASDFSAPAPEKMGAIRCLGSYFFYKFEVTTKTLGNVAVDGMTIVVTRGSTLVRKGTVAIATSDIQPGKSIEFSGRDARAGGAVAAAFNGTEYEGKLKVDSPEGGATVSVKCSLNY